MTPARAKVKKLTKQALTYALLITFSVFAIFPFLWALSTSFKSEGSILQYPPTFLPWDFSTEHYVTVIKYSNLLQYFGNSILILVGTTLLCVTLGAHAAYGVERFEFRGKQAVLFGILCTIMVPGVAIIVPLYLIMTSIGLADTRFGIMLVYSAWLIPTCLWMLRGFINTVPRTLDEAAQIDGCSTIGVFYRIILPLIRGGLAAAAIVVFRFSWNEFIIALTLSSSESTRTVPVGLYYFVTATGVDWGKLMASVVLALAPIVVLFVLLQRQFVQGMMAGSLKG